MRAWDKGRVTVMALLDYSRAFDSLNHQLLLSKLSYIGCSEATLSWFEDYLSDRRQVVRLKGLTSSEVNITRGIQQGSLIGPVMYTIYTADIIYLASKEVSLHLYADDTQVYVSCHPERINSAVHILNEDLERIVRWSSWNGLQINPSKTETICIGSVRDRGVAVERLRGAVRVDGHAVEFKPYVKNLGVLIDSHLTFNNFVKQKCATGYAKISSLYQYKNILPSDTKWRLVNSLVLSTLDYCSPVYYSHLTLQLLRRLQLLQNCCLRYSYCIPRRDHVTPHYNLLHILKLEYRFCLLYEGLIFSIVKTGLPTYLYVILTKRDALHDRTFRNMDMYHTPAHRTAKFENAFSFVAPSALNNNKDIFQSTNSILRFKNSLRGRLKSLQEM